MGNANRRTQLSEQIADILGTRGAPAGEHSRLAVRKTIACGSMMMLAFNPAQVGAVGLGEIELKSRLGQPLEATVPLTLRDGESLPKNCVKPSPERNTLAKLPDLRVVAPARTGSGTYSVKVSTTNPLHEPMYELSLMVQCPGATLLVRQYVLMLDLPGMPVAATVPAQATNPVPARNMVPRNAAPVSRNVASDPARALPPRADGIPAGSAYRVSHGDTLSTIAQRVDGRLPDTIWAVANRLFADNPRAFIGNDPNRIKLGSLIRIPEHSVLVTMAPGARLAPARTAQTPSVGASPVPERANLPSRAPVATSRNSVTAPRRSATPAPTRTMTSSSNTSWPVPGSPEADAAAERAAVAGVADQSRVTDTAATDTVTAEANDSANFNPFADETPTDAAGDSTTAAATPAAAVATTVDASAETSEPTQSTTLLAILIGLLLGAAASLVMLRGRLLAALGVGRRARPVAVKPRPVPATAELSQSGTFDPSLAAAAFDRSSGESGGATELPITGPIEDTYIVETQAAEPTIQDKLENLRTEVIESDTAEQPPASAAAGENDDDDSAELAKLFDNDLETSVGDSFYTPSVDDPTAEMPSPAGEALDPTAEMPGGVDAELEPTAQMPQQAGDEFFDPTAELPADALDDIFDPTGGVDDVSGAPMESTLMQAFNEDFENLDPDEMFATSSQSVESLAGGATADPLDVTVNDALADSVIDDPTMAADLGDLPRGDDEDDDLSATLQEALNLLERDFEEEFTASQILERSSLEQSLQEDLDREDTDETDDDIQRKIS